MCRAVHMLLQAILCCAQMFIRIVMTVLLMAENFMRMILQIIYNTISFILQLCSIIPICMVFIITAKLRCLFCGCGGGYRPVNRCGLCDCMMSTGKPIKFKFNMCRTVHSLLQTVICGVQMLVRVFMTTMLMVENLIRMILQTLYNFISFMLQLLSLIPICVVFLVTARLKCFMCGGGGACPVNRGGACDCLMSAVAIIIMFFIFRATGILDKIFFSLGYTKAKPMVYKFVPTPGDITECSRNDTDYTDASTNNLRFLQDHYEWTELYTSTYLDASEQTTESLGDTASSVGNTLAKTNNTYANRSEIGNTTVSVLRTGVPSAG